MINKISLGDHAFSVEARVAIQLGRESISSSLVAIGELIKNSYDADAEEVVIAFKNLNTSTPTIIITDDGEGMDDNTLLTKWMRIGTTHKSERGLSGKNRVYTGAKGLGRLGIDRLCTRLNLFTKTENSEHIYEADIQWEKYDQRQSTELDSIKHHVFKIPASSLPDQEFPINGKAKGSQYILSGLKDIWDDEFLTDLRKELSLLLSPFSKNLGFKIKFDTEGFQPQLDGYITSDHFLEAAEWRLTASISVDNNVSVTITDGKGNVNSSYSSSWTEWMKSGEETPNCGPLNFELYFMRNISSKNLDTDKFVSKDVRTFLKNNQGIRIYRDHFRVKPYGEPNGEGDWLGLAMRRVINPESIRMANWRIGYNQLVGAIFIGRESNPWLVDQTNREGLTETSAYFDLRSFALKCVELFEKHIHQKALEEVVVKPINLAKDLKESYSAYKDILEKLGTLKTNTKDQETQNQLSEIEATLNEETERTASIKEQIDQLEADKDTLANLASLGILSVSFGHETLGSISNAIANADLLKTKIHEGMFMLPPNIVEYAYDRFHQIDKSLEYIKIFGNFSLGNIKRDKRSRRSIEINSVVSNVVNSFQAILDKRRISCEIINTSKNPLIIKAYEIDWESIFANLISNSCYFLSDTPAEKRKIEIRLSEVENFCIVDFEDSGCGIESGVEKYIFNATFTTRRNKKGDSIGTGMGLSIVKTFIEAHSGGKIELAPKGILGGARFLIKVPATQAGN